MSAASDASVAVPLFASLVASSAAPRPFASALPARASGVVNTPWTPRVEVDSAGAQLSIEDGDAARAEHERVALETARREATEAGRAAGAAETADLRAKLARVIADLETTREDRVAHHAEAIADAATVVIEAWMARTHRTQLFTPIVRAWLDRAGEAAATAFVHPTDIAAMTAAIGDAAIAVEGDATMSAGDVRVRNSSFDSTHAWRERLRELRDAIATALEHDDAPEAADVHDVPDAHAATGTGGVA